jgi:hypothetical protein
MPMLRISSASQESSAEKLIVYGVSQPSARFASEAGA